MYENTKDNKYPKQTWERYAKLEDLWYIISRLIVTYGDQINIFLAQRSINDLNL